MALTKVIGAGIGSVSGVNLSSGNVTVVDGQGFYFGDGSYRIEGKDDGATTARIGFVAGGSEVARFTSSGLTFGGDTAAANALSDYEEGSFTATLSPNTSGTITLESDKDLMQYTKVGRLVTINGMLRISSVSSPVGDYFALNLPFTPSDFSELSGRTQGGVMMKDASTSGANAFEMEGSLLIEQQTQIRIYRDASTLGASDDVYVSCTYITTA